jgi:hypothetical protein
MMYTSWETPLKKFQWIKLENTRRFEMTNLKLLNHFLELEYDFQLDGITMIQWGM